ncbi:MAG TPA: secretin N-terminal domain-containing protein [Burkholderiales bacterium]|nr:secretin N-terminal domain-containing protein [Burkholderiales bacterium]
MRRIALAVLALAASACAHAPSPESEGHLKKPLEAAPSGNVPPPVQISTILPEPKPRLKPETYTVVVNGVKVQELLFALARDAKVNVDIHSGISGVVTLNAIDQTLPQLLSRIAKQVDMRWELDGPNLAVMPDSPYLHIYKIDYVNMERLTAGATGVSSQIGSISGTGGAGGGGIAGAAGANGSITTVRNTSDNKFWSTLERNIKDILHETDKILPAGAVSQTAAPQAPAGAPGAPPASAANVSFREAASVIVNPEASVVIVRATSRQHEKIQEFLDQVLANVKRQVLIEATIAEVSLNNQYQQGIDWTALRTRGLVSYSGNQVSGGSITTGPLLPVVPPSPIGGTVPKTGLPSSPTVPNVFTVAGAYGANFAAALQLLESFGNVRVLSSPRLSVLNNQTALLRVVDNIVYFNVQVSLAAATNISAPTTAVNTSPVTVPVGFVMNITPQISDDDTVLLNLKPTTTRLVKFIPDPNPALAVAGTQNLVPQLRMREMESLIKVNSGQMAVLGGLIEDSVNDVEDTVPVVNSIPILGSLFSSRNRSNTKTELVVFLRPLVIKDASIEGDYRAYRSLIPGENFTSQPNPGKTAPLSGMK